MSSDKHKNKLTKLLGTASLNDIVQINKWWEKQPEIKSGEDENSEAEGRWKHLEHNGVLFPPEYEQHGIKIKCKGEEIELNAEQEEVASFWAQIVGTDLEKKDIAIKNFTRELKRVLPEKYKDAKLSDFDFSAIKEHFEKRRENNKNKTTEEKKKEKKERQKMMDFYGWAICDGSCEKIANFLVEPPGLFRGRGEQPLTGTIKKRIAAEDVTINVGKDDPVPICTQKGHCWGEIVNNSEASWLAYYKVRKNFKYVFLAANSKFKGMSDYNKYEKAKRLKSCIGEIRKDYTAKFDSKDIKEKQLGVATYLIDRLALRVGNEKGEDEADTVGCCTIRVEHIKLEKNNEITLDFLAKDSMRYLNTVQVDEKVYKNLEEFIKAKSKSDNLFDVINASTLNDYLKSLMDDLSAKVFRTYNASIVLQEQLQKREFKADDSVDEKVAYYNEANKQVAILCNHQKTVPKNYNVKTEMMEKEIKENKEYLTELEQHLSSFSKKSKSKPKKGAQKSQESEVKPSIKKTFPNTKEKTEATIKALQLKLKKLEQKLKEREDNKQIALGTSKINYMDPRITVSWCKKYEVPIEKIFSKSIRDKFPWAMYTGEKYLF